ncbi:hypothetical protein D9M68_144240 [compost metagenome]
MAALSGVELNGPRGAGYRRMIEGCPVGRAGTPDEVGQVAALLMGPDGAFITGFKFDRRSPCPDDVVIEIHYCGVCHSDVQTSALLNDLLAVRCSAPFWIRGLGLS